MTEENKKRKENITQIPNPHVFGKGSSFEEYQDYTLLHKIFKDNKNLTTMAETIKNTKLFKGQISSKNDIIKMLENLTLEQRKYYFTLFFPNLDKKDKYSIFYYLEKSINDIDAENEVSYQKEEEEKNKSEDRDYGFLMNEEYQNFASQENSISNKDTKEGTDKNDEYEKIDEEKLRNLFLQSIKINLKKNNSKDKISYGSISFDIESLLLSNNLETILKYFTKNEYFNKWIMPIYCENEWYLPLPKWTYSISKFDVYFQTLIIYLELVTLLLYEYFTLTGQILPEDNIIYMQHMNKISELEKESNSITATSNSEKNNNNLLEKEKKEKLEKPKKEEKKEKMNAKQISGKKKKKSRKNKDLTLLSKIMKYIDVNNNILKQCKEKIIKNKKDLCEKLLKNNYDIEFRDYGSSVTGLELPTSDIDTLIFYIGKDKSKFIDKRTFGFQLCQLLELEKERNDMITLSIKSVLDASVPIIKLEYDIINEIDVKNREMLKKEGLTKVKIDISFTNEECFYKIQEDVKQFIMKDLDKYTNLKPLVLIIKFLLDKKKLNNSHTGGLNSISVFFLAKHVIVTYEKENLTLEQLFYKFLDKYSKYDFTYGLDIYGNTIPYPLNGSKKIFISNNFIDNKNFNFAYNCDFEKVIDYFKKLKNKFGP